MMDRESAMTPEDKQRMRYKNIVGVFLGLFALLSFLIAFFARPGV